MLKNTFSFIKDLISSYIEDDGFTKGAALAYYTTFSIAPIIFILIAIAGVFFGQAAVKGEVFIQLQGLIGPEVAETVEKVVEASYKSEGNIWVTILGFVTLLFGATGAFHQLKLSLDQIWQIEPYPSNGALGFLKARMISFAMILGLGFLLLVSLVVETLAVGIGQRVARQLSFSGESYLPGITGIISLLLSIAIFAAIFKFLPDAKVRWKEVLWGSLFTAILFALGRSGIGYYIGNSALTTGFGAAGSLVALLVWTYYSSQTVFLGAEFIWLVAKRTGNPILPGNQAVLVVKQTKKIETIPNHKAVNDRKNSTKITFGHTQAERSNPGFRHQSSTIKRKEP